MSEICQFLSLLYFLYLYDFGFFFICDLISTLIVLLLLCSLFIILIYYILLTIYYLFSFFLPLLFYFILLLVTFCLFIPIKCIWSFTMVLNHIALDRAQCCFSGTNLPIIDYFSVFFLFCFLFPLFVLC
jgi:hypothetical protein